MAARTGVRWSSIFAVAIVLLGCEQTRTPVGLDGQLAVFTTDPANPIFGRDSDWRRLGSADDISHRVVYESAAPVLEITANRDNAAFIRRVDAQLLATPFLFWSWSVRNGPPAHPIRLVVGFADAGLTDQRGAFSGLFGGEELPAYSRSITLNWGGSALQRGFLNVSPGTKNIKPHATYTVRGGPENRNRWWPENLDLSHLHAMAWPAVDMAHSRIVFIGISSAASTQTGTMRLSGLRLSR